MKKEIRKFPKGSIVFRTGEKVAAAYLIKSGIVTIYGYDGAEKKEFAKMTEGDIFGEMALIECKHHSMTAEASSDSVLILIRPEELEEKLKNADPLVRNLIHMFIDRMRKTNDLLKSEKSSQLDFFEVFCS